MPAGVPGGIRDGCRSRSSWPGRQRSSGIRPSTGTWSRLRITGRAFQVEKQPPARSEPLPDAEVVVTSTLPRPRPSASRRPVVAAHEDGVAQRRLQRVRRRRRSDPGARDRPGELLRGAARQREAGDHAPEGRGPASRTTVVVARPARCRAPRPDRACGRSTRSCPRARRSTRAAASWSRAPASCPARR